MADIEVARAVITIVPTMEGAQQSITEQLTGAATSSGVQKAGKTAGSTFGSGLAKGLGAATAATAAVGAAAVGAGKAFVSAAGDVAEYGDNIDKMSQKLGLSYEGYQKWDYVLGQAGVDIDSMQTGLKTLTNKLDDAKNGSADAQDMFAQLGISMEDLASMSREDIFEAAIAGFQGMADTTERAALANDLFGKSGQNLIPLFNTSTEETHALMQAAEDLGMVMSEDAVKASAGFNDSLDTMQRSLSGMKNNFISDFLPGITGAMDGLTAVFTGDSEGGIQMIGESIDEIVAQMTANLPKIMEIGLGIVEALATAVIDNLPALADSALQLVGSIADFAIENLPMLIDVALNMLLTIADGIIENLPVIIPAVVDVILQIVDKLTAPDMIVKLVEAALQIMVALADGLIKALPQLIAKIPEIIANIIEAIVRALPLILQAGVELILTFIDGIVGTFGKVIETGANIVNTIKDGFAEKVQAAKDWGKDLIDNFISGIKAKWDALKNTISNVANTIKDFLGFSEPEEGALSDFHTFAPDMIDLFAKGITQNIGTIQSAMGELTGLMSEDMNATVTAVGASGPSLEASDFSGQQALAGAGGDITIPVYLGTDLLDTVIVKANQRINLRSGGVA